MACHGSLQSLSTDQTTSTAAESCHSSQRFRFKSKSSKRHVDDDLHDSSQSTSRRPHRRHHRHPHRDKRRKVSQSGELQSPSPHREPSSTLNPDVAFRESLFDAMGDDEGAAYWESVYGQPIHNYPDEKRNEKTGELDKMTEEEYIAFVRRGMWEKSLDGIEAQKEERRRSAMSREKEERKNASTKREENADVAGDGGLSPFEREVEESLRRGHHRKEKKMWRETWDAYEHAWDGLYGLAKSRNASADGPNDKVLHLRNQIVWPVESGRRKDVCPREIESFMVKTAGSLVGVGDPISERRQLLSHLKLERVRWHPDKVQQRFGTLNIDERTLKGVTEVFQVMDRLYSERK